MGELAGRPIGERGDLIGHPLDRFGDHRQDIAAQRVRRPGDPRRQTVQRPGDRARHARDRRAQIPRGTDERGD